MTDKKGTISLNKFISRTGLCSRREADRWIEEGRLSINGQIAKKGNRVSIDDDVKLDNEVLKIKEALVYLVCNKPSGITCTTDKNDPSSIFKLIDLPMRLFPVGRTEKLSEGLVIITNDGDLANGFIEYSGKIEMEYVVTLSSSIKRDFFQKISNGLTIKEEVTNKCQVQQMGKSIFKIKLYETINRQIHAMCHHLGFKVIHLRRVRIDKITMRGLGVGEWRHLSEAEILDIKTILS